MYYLNAMTPHWLIILVISIGVAAGVTFRDHPIYNATDRSTSRLSDSPKRNGIDFDRSQSVGKQL